MTALTIVPGADFSAGGLRLNRTIAGMPARGLLGLWLFDDMPEGQPFASVLDQSGNGRHAQLMPGYAPAVRASYGASIPGPDGSIYDTGLSFNRRMTIVVAVSNPLPGNQANYFNVLFGTTGSGFDGNPANANPNTAPVLHYNGTNAAGGASTIYDADGAQIGSVATALTGAPLYNQPGAFAISIDGDADSYSAEWMGAPRVSRVNAGIGDYWDGSTDRGNLIIGCHPFSSARSPAATLCRVYGYAAYDRPLASDDAQSVMQSLRQIAIARGVAW